MAVPLTQPPSGALVLRPDPLPPDPILAAVQFERQPTRGDAPGNDPSPQHRGDHRRRLSPAAPSSLIGHWFELSRGANVHKLIASPIAYGTVVLDPKER